MPYSTLLGSRSASVATPAPCAEGTPTSGSPCPARSSARMSLRTTKGGVVEEEVLVGEVVLLVGLLPPPRGSARWLRLRSLAVSVDGAVQDRARSPCAVATGGSEMAVTRASPRTMRRRRDWRVASPVRVRAARPVRVRVALPVQVRVALLVRVRVAPLVRVQDALLAQVQVAPLGRVPRANYSARKPAPARGWVASGRPSRPTQSAGWSARPGPWCQSAAGMAAAQLRASSAGSGSGCISWCS